MYIFFYVIVLFWFCIGIFLYYVGGVVGYLLNFKLWEIFLEGVFLCGLKWFDVIVNDSVSYDCVVILDEIGF